MLAIVAKSRAVVGMSDPHKTRIGKIGRAGYDRPVTDRARKVLEDALTLSSDERIELAEQLLSSVPADGEWLAELERRARRALADPNGGEAWDVVERRLAARVVR